MSDEPTQPDTEPEPETPTDDEPDDTIDVGEPA